MSALYSPRYCCYLWPALLLGTLLSATISAAPPPQQAKEPPGQANEKRWLAERKARIDRLPAEQRRRLDEAEALFRRGHRYQGRTDYERAEPLYRQAAETAKEIVGEEDPLYLECLSNLGVLFQDTGDYPQALRLFEQLLKVYRKHLGEIHPSYGLTLHNLGDVLVDMGELARAEPLLLRSLEIFRQTIGEKTPLYNQNLANLSKLYKRKGDFGRAEEFQLRTLDILIQAGQKDQPPYATELNNLALLYLELGDFPKAEETLLRAHKLKEKLGRSDWPVPGVLPFNLGALYYAKKDYAKAEKYLHESLQIIRRHFENTVIVQSERRQLNLAQSLRHRLDKYLSLAVEAHLPPEQVYEAMLTFKGSVFAHQYWVRLARHRTEKDDEADRLYRQLQDTARKLAAATFAEPDPQKPHERQEKIQQLSDRKERLEAELSRRSGTFTKQQAFLRPTLGDLGHALPSGAAFIDFLEFHYSPPAARNDKSPKPEWRMLAVVTRPDRPLEWRDLGSAQAIARACTNWRKELADDEASASPQRSTAAAEVRRLIWQPLEPLLDGVRNVLLCPDGALSFVPLAALPGSQPDSYLIEERAIAVMPVTQLAPQALSAMRDASSPAKAASLLLLGDVDFEVRSQQGRQDAAVSPGLRAARGSRSLHFDRLAGTAREIEAIRGSFTQAYPEGGVSEVRRGDATKSAFVRQAAGKRYLHLATHGFFAPPEMQSGLSRPPSDQRTGRKLLRYHPGVLSGLALAGAGSKQASTGEDGILTALEVAALDLSAADLVVLSACETGLGDAAGGEGLLGLQRAFQIAGARSVVASLWKVDDAATEQLMTRFYENLWQKHLPLLDALRQAQLDMLRRGSHATKLRGPGQVKSVPENAPQGRTHPRLWAAWVLSGDPGDLTRLSEAEPSARETILTIDPIDADAHRKSLAWPLALGAGLLVCVVLVVAVLRSRRRRSQPAA